jgi:hypothetical protein
MARVGSPRYLKREMLKSKKRSMFAKKRKTKLFVMWQMCSWRKRAAPGVEVSYVWLAEARLINRKSKGSYDRKC